MKRQWAPSDGAALWTKGSELFVVFFAVFTLVVVFIFVILRELAKHRVQEVSIRQHGVIRRDMA